MITFTLFIAFCAVIHCDADQFDVLKMSDVPFPSLPPGSSHVGVAAINASYVRSIPDYTVCYRFLLESYNDGLLAAFRASTDREHSGMVHVLDRMGGFGTGYESEGLQGGLMVMMRNVTGGGIGGKNFPHYHAFVFPKDIEISKWYQLCFSYSNKLNHFHLYVDGLKSFDFTYQDDSEPLPSDAFAHIGLGMNMRGSLTGLHIYNRYLDEDQIIGRTRTCEVEDGEIFAWDKNRINILQVLQIFISYVLTLLPPGGKTN